MKWSDHHKPIIGYVKPLYGFYKPDEASLPKPKAFLNKGYRNLAYIIHSYLTRTEQTVIKTDGASKTYRWWRGVGEGSEYWRGLGLPPFNIGFGGSSAPHDVTRYQLISPYFDTAPAFHYLVEETDRTIVRIYSRYAAGIGFEIGEAGLYYFGWGTGRYLLARAIVSPAISRSPATVYEDGWDLIFPAGWTRWFVRVFFAAYDGGSTTNVGEAVRRTDGTTIVIRNHADHAFRGEADVVIGRDNTPPTPEDFRVRNPIASLSSQAQSVEIDTTFQECRVVRTGTYTPSTTETLGEVGLTTRGIGTDGATHTYLVARAVFDPPITLEAGVTYTIGIALRLG